MKGKIKIILASLAVMLCGFAVATPVVAEGVDYYKYLDGTDGSGTGTAETSGPRTTNLMTTVNTVINLALGLIGLVAVVMIIAGGFQYVTSSGDTAKVTKAKNTIVYGIVGLVIALLAYAIVNFVLTKVFGG